MQSYLDEGKNNVEIARLEGVTEGSTRYAIKTGKLNKTDSYFHERTLSAFLLFVVAIITNALSPSPVA